MGISSGSDVAGNKMNIEGQKSYLASHSREDFLAQQPTPSPQSLSYFNFCVMMATGFLFRFL